MWPVAGCEMSDSCDRVRDTNTSSERTQTTTIFRIKRNRFGRIALEARHREDLPSEADELKGSSLAFSFGDGGLLELRLNRDRLGP